MNLEDYIKNLTPELQEKARACRSADELIALAKEAKVPVPDEALAAIAGGDQPDSENCKKIKCPRCGSTNIEGSIAEQGEDILPSIYKCLNCGYTFLD